MSKNKPQLIDELKVAKAQNKALRYELEELQLELSGAYDEVGQNSGYDIAVKAMEGLREQQANDTNQNSSATALIQGKVDMLVELFDL